MKSFYFASETLKVFTYSTNWRNTEWNERIFRPIYKKPHKNQVGQLKRRVKTELIISTLFQFVSLFLTKWNYRQIAINIARILLNCY